MDGNIIIKKMESDSEIRGKAYVHWKSWHETYSDLVCRDYMDKMTLEKCEDLAHRWLGNILVAKDGEDVVGFAGYGAYRDGTMSDVGEVYSIYVLKKYFDRGVGRALMDAAVEKLAPYKKIAVWVLDGNDRAIRFYEKYGFKLDGVCSEITLGEPRIERRMIMQK